MDTYINIAQVLISILILLVILAQVRESGSGLFGSAQSTMRTRRGLEKTLFQFTIILSAIFLGISIMSVRVAGGLWVSDDTWVLIGIAVVVLLITLTVVRPAR